MTMIGCSLYIFELQKISFEGSFCFPSAKNGSNDDLEEEGTRHFMVNIIEPQFNLHSEDANVSYLGN